MLVCSIPVFVNIEQSKAARFVSVPMLPTVAYCECKEEDMYCNIKRPEIWSDKKRLGKVESSLCIRFVKVKFEEHKIGLFIYCISYFRIESALSSATLHRVFLKSRSTTSATCIPVVCAISETFR